MKTQAPQSAAGHAGNGRTSPPTARLIVYGNPAKPGLPPVLGALVQWARARHAALSLAADLAALLPEAEHPGPCFSVYGEAEARAQLEEAEQAAGAAPAPPALLVSLGGDGTLMRAVHQFWPFTAPVLSVNLGSLGFNASVEPAQITQALDDWAEGRAQTSPRMVIRVRWRREGQTLAETIAVNDVVLVKQYEARMIHFSLLQGQNLLSSFAADGLILATPTGSTAYNLSAGGPIVFPTLRALIATAICPHTLAARPMILPASPEVTMEFALRRPRDQAMLWIDGQEHWPMDQGDRVTVEALGEPVRLISSGSGQYFATLRQKLCWSGEFAPQAGPEDPPA